MKNIVKKALKLLTAKERKRLYMLFGAMTASALIAVIGIASVFPFLSLITDSSIVGDNQILNWLYNTFKFQSYNRFLIFIGILVLVFLIISNVLVLLTHWGLARYSWNRNFSISRRLLSAYLHRPYIFYLNKNTSELGKNILSEVQQVVTGVLIPLMQMFSSIIVSLLIFAMLIAIEPMLALSVIVVIGGAYIFIYRIVRSKLSDIGQKRYKTNAERFKAVSEAFGGIKQLKLSRCEEVFLKSYSEPSSKFARYVASHQIISEAPVFIMEIVAFGGIIIIVLYLLAAGRGFQNVLPLIGLFAFSAYRLMPALQKIFNSITKVRFNARALDVLYEDIYSFDYKPKPEPVSNWALNPIRLKHELKLENVRFSYPGTRQPVIDNLNIKIKANTSVAFVGETGAGKTTVADIILGLLKPDKGRIMVDNIEVNEYNLPEWQRNLGYIPQDIYLQDDTVLSNIAFGVSKDKINAERAKTAAKIANIDDFIIKELPNGYDTIIGERGIRLSGGQRQRIGIARALYHDPEVLVLDEATSALDGITENAVFGAIQNLAKTKTLIIIAHRLTTVKECDVIYVLKDGNVIGIGKYEDLIDTNEEFRKMAKAYL
jgi:ATP-binding cassette, subfamily B, bacterial PglK